MFKVRFGSRAETFGSRCYKLALQVRKRSKIHWRIRQWRETHLRLRHLSWQL